VVTVTVWQEITYTAEKLKLVNRKLQSKISYAIIKQSLVLDRESVDSEYFLADVQANTSTFDAPYRGPHKITSRATSW
jgi:hypothetical protein